MAPSHSHSHTPSHSHSHARPGPDAGAPTHVSRTARTVVVVLLVAAALASLAGVATWWPDDARADELTGSVGFAAPGVTFPQAEVTSVQPACALAGEDDPVPGAPIQDGTCGMVGATVADGADRGREVTVTVPPEVSASGLQRGDTIELQLTPPFDGQPGQASYFGTERSTPLGLLAAAFVLVVLVVARWRGLMALLGLAFSALVVGVFVLPALLSGEPAVPVAMAGSTAIMFVVLFSTHGVSMRTATALVGTLAGVAVSAVVGTWAVDATRLTGISDESGGVLYSLTGGLDFQGLLIAAIVIAGLGVLNDVTITQASAVWELRAASPELTRRQTFSSGMRIGRDHIASTIYTIVFVYVGTALSILLVISLYDRSPLELVGTEEIAEEVVRSLASSIGLVLAVPLTTLIAALTAGPPRTPRGRRVAGS